MGYWLAEAEYEDGSFLTLRFSDGSDGDYEQQCKLEEKIATRKDGCVWYSVVWVSE